MANPLINQGHHQAHIMIKLTHSENFKRLFFTLFSVVILLLSVNVPDTLAANNDEDYLSLIHI